MEKKKTCLALNIRRKRWGSKGIGRGRGGCVCLSLNKNISYLYLKIHYFGFSIRVTYGILPQKQWSKLLELSRKKTTISYIIDHIEVKKDRYHFVNRPWLYFKGG